MLPWRNAAELARPPQFGSGAGHLPGTKPAVRRLEYREGGPSHSRKDTAPPTRRGFSFDRDKKAPPKRGLSQCGHKTASAACHSDKCLAALFPPATLREGRLRGPHAREMGRSYAAPPRGGPEIARSTQVSVARARCFPRFPLLLLEVSYAGRRSMRRVRERPGRENLHNFICVEWTDAAEGGLQLAHRPAGEHQVAFAIDVVDAPDRGPILIRAGYFPRKTTLRA